jgi:LuxR family maltose regulon positive regulatory protein
MAHRRFPSEAPAHGAAVPSIGGDLRFVRRERVLRILQQCPEPVVCLQAPGGYGKTTVLAQWVGEDRRPVVWITVRPQAPDATWIVGELLAALSATGLIREIPSVPAADDLVEWHLAVLPVIEQAVGYPTLPYLIVIDEAGSMRGQRWESLVAAIAGALPPHCQLVLSTRSAIPAALSRVRARGDLRMVETGVLALDAVEGADLMRLTAVTLPDDTFLDLMETTEGWPVAVYLSLLAAKSGRAPVSRTASWLSSTGLPRYLRDEILARLSPADAQFLLRCSVLPDLDEAACDAVTGQAGSLARLCRLAQSQHLVVALDGFEPRFRMNPLLSAFLSDELRVTDPGVWRMCHERASRAREMVGDLDGAVYHARTAADDGRLSELVWQYAGVLIGTGHLPVLQRWIDGVDAARVAAHPGLAMACAWMGVQRGDAALVARMEAAVEAVSRAEGDRWEAPLLLLRATAWTQAPAELEAQMRRYLHLADPAEPWCSVAWFLLGVATALQDHEAEATAALGWANRLALAHDLPAMQARCLSALAQLELAQGQRVAALAQIQRARSVIAEHQLDHLATTGPVFVSSAAGYLLEDRRAEARREALRALRLVSRSTMVPSWTLVFGRLSLAQVFQALGDVDRSSALVHEAERQYGRAARAPAVDRAFAEIAERIRSVRNAGLSCEVLSTAELRLLQHLPTHLSYPQIANELSLSKHTVKTQGMAIYRKLGVNTRDDAIRRATEMGLLERS